MFTVRAFGFVVVLVGVACAADPVLSTRWTVLHRPMAGGGAARPLAARGLLQPLPELQFTGPMPAHPFVLGNFAADGAFGIVDGGIELVDGKNAAVRLAPLADQFELEGRIAMKDQGGWFLLIGWNEETGNGYAIHNCTLRESGAPWFLCEMRGREAVEDTNQELKQFEWKGTQEARVTVKGQQVTVELGAVKVLDGESLPNYQPGEVIFGVYDTRYGPRPVRIESLRIRAIE